MKTPRHRVLKESGFLIFLKIVSWYHNFSGTKPNKLITGIFEYPDIIKL
jgi:hypothetical protein